MNLKRRSYEGVLSSFQVTAIGEGSAVVKLSLTNSPHIPPFYWHIHTADCGKFISSFVVCFLFYFILVCFCHCFIWFLFGFVVVFIFIYLFIYLFIYF